MQQVTVKAARWSQDSEGAWLCLRVKSPEAAMEVCDALKPGKEYTATIKGTGQAGGALRRFEREGIPAGDTEHRRRQRGTVPAGKGGGGVLPELGPVSAG